MKNRHLSIFIALLLSLLLLTLSALSLIGCAPSEEPDEPSGDIGGSEEGEGEKTLPLTIAGNDLENYKIIYDDNKFARDCAMKIWSEIVRISGKNLPMRTDAEAEGEFEILVGKTNRSQSAAVRAEYDRPNVYYTVKTVESKLVIMAEGVTTLEKVGELFVKYLSVEQNRTISGNVISGDVLGEFDSSNISIANPATGTDLRVFHWNMAAPYLNPSVTPPPVVYDSNVIRGLVMADIILMYYPDVITTNEFYKSHNGDSSFFDAVMNELGEYYTCLDSPYDTNKPEDGAEAIPGKTINSNIIYKRDAGLEVIDSSWRYSTEKTKASASNPGGWVYYHGSHTAVFSKNGNRFILSVAHYADSRSKNQWAKEHLAAVADAQALYGRDSALPVILTGDMYVGQVHTSPDSGYKYLAANGYYDAQRTAKLNANENIQHGTFHVIGEIQTARLSEDFVWYTDEIEALAFKVIATQDTADTSDHYPVIADLSFK